MEWNTKAFWYKENLSELPIMTTVEELNKSKKTLTLEEVWSDYFSEIDIPVIHSFPHGHISDFVTVPIGIKIKLNAGKGQVEFEETGVR